MSIPLEIGEEIGESIVKEISELVIGNFNMYEKTYRRKFPSDILIVGHNWALYGPLEKSSEYTKSSKHGMPLEEHFKISPAIVQEESYIPLEDILVEFEDDVRDEEFALFPLSKRREDELEMLGTKEQIYDDWYTIHGHKGKIIIVFPLI